MRALTFAIATALASLASAASAAPEASIGASPADGSSLPRGQCFRSHDIRSHTIADRQTLLFGVNNRDVYRVTVDPACLAGAMSSDPIVTRTPPGSATICKPIDLDLAVAQSGFESRCIVRSIVKLTPEDVAALPRKIRP